MLKAIMESSARSFKFDEILGLNKTVVEYNRFRIMKSMWSQRLSPPERVYDTKFVIIFFFSLA